MGASGLFGLEFRKVEDQLVEVREGCASKEEQDERHSFVTGDAVGACQC